MLEVTVLLKGPDIPMVFKNCLSPSLSLPSPFPSPSFPRSLPCTLLSSLPPSRSLHFQNFLEVKNKGKNLIFLLTTGCLQTTLLLELSGTDLYIYFMHYSLYSFHIHYFIWFSKQISEIGRASASAHVFWLSVFLFSSHHASLPLPSHSLSLSCPLLKASV